MAVRPRRPSVGENQIASAHCTGQSPVRKLGAEALERRRKAVPLRTEGTGWDVGHATVYLASDEARWVTGVMLPIDGGFSAIREWPR